MTLLQCTQGHTNPSINRFCQECGQPLMINNRYQIVRHLSQGGFGRTYLVEDINQNHQQCVLKEFAPQVQNQTQLSKAEELFEREASILLSLQHPQIPRLRERFKTSLGGKEYLFIAEDYIEGQTYQDLLVKRQQQGLKFTELEIIQLLRDILPILSYIHAQNPPVIHRDISPDNLILRNSDHLPVLIDFGGVKQLQAQAQIGAIAGFLSPAALPTRLGKPGYAPDEQLTQGKVSPSSDLYALAVTALVLLTGEEATNLYDAYKALWRWGDKINVSPQLESVLKRMLAYKPNDRYQSAQEVIQAINAIASTPSPQQNMSQLHTRIVAPANPQNVMVGNGRAAATPLLPPPQQANQPSNNPPVIKLPSLKIPISLRWLGITATGIIFVILAGMISFSIVNSFIHSSSSNKETANLTKEQQRVANIASRRKALGITEPRFNQMVDQRFYAKYPQLNNRPLRSGQEDAALRQQWYDIAEKLLVTLEQGKN